MEKKDLKKRVQKASDIIRRVVKAISPQSGLFSSREHLYDCLFRDLFTFEYSLYSEVDYVYGVCWCYKRIRKMI